ncbi:MAG: hypothetical protein LBT79_04045 [Elusimicrobiota bacterium]|jgi:hypothetical protein|nr:hypothetical protein [Elusimicrobiota bacterium]
MNVFISGSIGINKLPKTALEKIDNIINQNMTVYIGDAKGVDLLVQKYLSKKKYNNVVVYFVSSEIRNNVGKWQARHIETNITKKSRELYTVKDEAMAKEADYGLMIWDGQSKGTLNNIQNMKSVNKRFFVILDGMVIRDSDIDSLISLTKQTASRSQMDLF